MIVPAAVKDSFLDLERHRQLLETNVEKLRKSLQHWQTWSAEYEGLKEEVLALHNPSPGDILRLTETYEGELVTKSEIEDILGVKGKPSTTVPRNADQIVNVLDRRIDYVSQNVKTVEKQLETAEEKAEKAAMVGRPEATNEEGLPLMEIFEELDEAGNVIEGRVEAHGGSKAVFEEVLRKAGVKPDDLPHGGKNEVGAAAQASKNSSESGKDTKAPPRPSKALPARPKVKKSVSFAEEVQVQEQPKAESQPSTAQIKAAEKDAERLEAVMKRAAHLNKPIESPVIPNNESPEDAKLRNEMLQYGMSEVGAVVAELDFEDDSDFSDSAYDDDDEDTTDLEEEDAFGRSTRQVVNDEIRQQMRELEVKLGVRMMQNAGPRPDVEPEVLEELESEGPVVTPGMSEEDLALALLEKAVQLEAEKDSNAKKAVRFAEELDISPPPAPVADQSKQIPAVPARTKAPISDIVERTPTAVVQPTPVAAPSAPAQKQSRFKSSRAPGPNPIAFIPPKPIFEPTRTRTVPSGPANKTLADTVVEKETPAGGVAEPDDYDSGLLQQEVATEYYKKRNLMIAKQGGFKDFEKEEEERTGKVEFTEDEGGPKRVSRFMAARLARQ